MQTKYFSMFSGIGGFEKGIEQAWNVLNAEKLGKYTKAGEIAKTVKSHTPGNGEQKTENTQTSTQETVGGSGGSKSSMRMEASVSAVEKQQSSFLLSTTLTTMGQKKGVGLGEEESITKSLARDSQTDTSFSVTTATLQKDFTENAPICVGYSEIDRYAIKLYERHFKHDNYGDATTINPDTLPDFNLLVGGFPCQAFSVAGKRAGFNDTRGTLFFDIARILKEKQPRHLVLENVKGLLSHDSGSTFTTIIGVLTDLGYSVEWQVLNSKDFGVPQNRERVIIVGHLGGECRGKVFPISGDDPKTVEQGLVTVSAVTGIKYVQLSPTLDTMYKKGLGSKQARPAVHQLNNPTHSNDRVYGTDGVSPTLNTMQGGNRQPFIAAQRGRGEPPVQRLEVQPEDKTNTLTAVAKDNYVVDVPRIRRLTPVECERLQGFPDNWTKYGINEEPISDTQRYKMCGNAVTTNVIQAVIERLIDHV